MYTSESEMKKFIQFIFYNVYEKYGLEKPLTYMTINNTSMESVCKIFDLIVSIWFYTDTR